MGWRREAGSGMLKIWCADGIMCWFDIKYAIHSDHSETLNRAKFDVDAIEKSL